VGIYLTNEIEFDVVSINDLVRNCENVFIKAKNAKMRQLIIGAIYRHPKDDTHQFMELLQRRLNFFSSQHYDVCLLGDFNENLDPQNRLASATEYLNTLLASNGMLPLITKYTRISQNSKLLTIYLPT